MTRPPEEWQTVFERVAPFAATDPESHLHRVAMSVTDGRLRWVATDSYRMAILDAGPVDLPDCEILLSPIQVAFAASQVASGFRVTLGVGDEFDVPIVEAEGVSCGMGVDCTGWPDVEEVLADTTPSDRGSTVRVSAAALTSVVSAIGSVANGADIVHLGIAAGEDELVFGGTDGGRGVFRFVIECESDPGDGAAAAGVQPGLFAAVVAAIRGETVDITVPLNGQRRAVTVSDGNWSAHLMPMTPADVIARAQLRTAIEEAFDGEVEMKADGTYTVDCEGVSVEICVRDGEMPVVLASTVLLGQVSESLELLREVNEFNRSAQGCRAYVADREVILESELSLTTVDGDELEAAVLHLGELVLRLAPLMTMFFVE